MGIFLNLWLIVLTLTGPAFVLYGAYLLTNGKKNQRIKAIALIVGGVIAGFFAYTFNTLLL